MTRLVLTVISAAFISIMVTPLVRRLAIVLNVVDRPDERKVHLAPVPLLGGVAIYGALIAALFINGTGAFAGKLVSVLLGATLVTVVGVWDDRFGMHPLVKLAGILLAAALIIVVAGIQVRLLRFEWLNIAITLFWVVGIVNAINFLDNMDGLAAGLVSVSAASFMLLAVLEDLTLASALGAATLGACAGFLYHNLQPANIFMGDAGSLLLGYTLAVLGLTLEFSQRPLASTWMIPIVVLALPIFDTTLVVMSRLRGGRPVYVGGKDHISHRLVSHLGMSHEQAVITLYYAAAALGMLAIIIRDAAPWQAQLIGAGLATFMLTGLVWFERGWIPISNSNSSEQDG